MDGCIVDQENYTGMQEVGGYGSTGVGGYTSLEDTDEAGLESNGNRVKLKDGWIG